MDKEILLKKVRALESRKGLFNLLNEIKADLLGDSSYPFTYRQFIILCNPKYSKNRYHSFKIPKKSGGIRQICAPCGNLKWFQICLNEVFKVLYSPSPFAMGFTEGRSIVDNARIHTNQNYVFNIDLKDFFPSIDQARVWKRLQLAPFNFNAKIAGVIAGLCSVKSARYSEKNECEECYVLPQGAPTSPLLTNAICDTLDRRLHGLAKRFGLHYSRYADDITFSSMHNVYQSNSIFRQELERIIIGQRFTINENKTRLAHCSKRQEVTGLIVGAKINVARKYVRDIRAILHIWEKYGINAAFATFYPHYRSEKCQLHRGEPNMVNIIAGKLCYLKMVKGEKDPVYVKLNTQFIRLTENKAKEDKIGNISYLFTTSKMDFENKLGVTIEFVASRENPYAFFFFQGRRFIVAISKNLDVNNLPENVQISLTRMKTQVKSQENSDKQEQSEVQTEIRIGYLLHKRLRIFPSEGGPILTEQAISPDISDLVMSLSTNEKNFINTPEQDNLLARLVESDFDLSTLP